MITKYNVYNYIGFNFMHKIFHDVFINTIDLNKILLFP